MRGRPCVETLRKNQKLNKVEKIKLERHPLEVREAVIDTYSKKGIESMNEVPGEVRPAGVHVPAVEV